MALTPRDATGVYDMGVPLSARSTGPEGPAHLQQKMLRQRQLVLKRQSEAMKSFGVVAQKHPPLAAADANGKVPGWEQFLATLDPNSPSCSTVPSARDVIDIRAAPAAPQQQADEQDQDEKSFDMVNSAAEDALPSRSAIFLDGDAPVPASFMTPSSSPEPPLNHGQGWDLEICAEDMQKEQQTGARSFWRPWRAGERGMADSDADAVLPLTHVIGHGEQGQHVTMESPSQSPLPDGEPELNSSPAFTFNGAEENEEVDMDSGDFTARSKAPWGLTDVAQDVAKASSSRKGWRPWRSGAADEDVVHAVQFNEVDSVHYSEGGYASNSSSARRIKTPWNPAVGAAGRLELPGVLLAGGEEQDALDRVSPMEMPPDVEDESFC
eukprot:gb/GFBE01051659.1/.p1 GENE.gb/GFBE01051659.1/~~gb/GFBE01051659.1/.p1  ORF type:complete len:381 (+),score=92.00 gb/GFBE01051659.1/:1-1143(+)